jgi:hypothetical protein
VGLADGVEGEDLADHRAELLRLDEPRKLLEVAPLRDQQQRPAPAAAEEREGCARAPEEGPAWAAR